MSHKLRDKHRKARFVVQKVEPGGVGVAPERVPVSSDQLWRTIELLETLPAGVIGPHLTDEQFLAYAEGAHDLAPTEVELVEVHLSSCDDCAKTAEDLLCAVETWKDPQHATRVRERLAESLASATSFEVPEPPVEGIKEGTLATPETSANTSVRPVARLNHSELIAAVDIGSSKVGVLIGWLRRSGDLEILGRGLAPNRGTRRGNVVNVVSTVEALGQAIEEAEVMAGVDVSRAWVGIAGSDIRSVNSRGMVSVTRKDREITRQDIDRVLEAAKPAALPSDREILHAIPQEFLVDEQGGIQDPVGMRGSRLEVKLHLVTGNVARTKTLVTCVNRAGIEVVELVFEPLATGEAVLTPDERELGVLLLDIGSGTTDYVLFMDGCIQHSAVLPVGAGHFTNDLAMVLRTPFAEAERIKVKSGCCLESLVADDQGISVPTVAGAAPRVVLLRELAEILQPRAEELFEVIRADLAKQGFDETLRGGVVLTGGGAQLEGLLEMAEQVFDSAVRYGLASGPSELADVIGSPAWAMTSGMLRYAMASEERREPLKRVVGWSVKGMVGNLRGRFSDLI